MEFLAVDAHCIAFHCTLQCFLCYRQILLPVLRRIKIVSTHKIGRQKMLHAGTECAAGDS